MDEATSTLDLQNEALCMQRVLDEEIAILTIAHRPSVVRYHQLMLTMELDGSFTPTPLVEVRRPARVYHIQPKSPKANPLIMR